MGNMIDKIKRFSEWNRLRNIDEKHRILLIMWMNCVINVIK